MRKLLFVLLFLPFTLFAQNVTFGYFSLSAVMDSLPQYKAAQDEYNALLERCDSEIAHSEEELTRCYVSFLDGQSSFPEPILRKRQKELQDLVDRSVVMRDQMKEWLVQAHDSLFLPIVGEIDRATARVCLIKNLAYALDSDKEACRYINPNCGIDITSLVIKEVLAPYSLETESVEAAVKSVEEAAEAAHTPATETPAEESLPEVELVPAEEVQESVQENVQ